MSHEVVLVSPVRVLVYTTLEGVRRSVAFLWRWEPESDWSCGVCDNADCTHVRAFRRTAAQRAG